MWADLCLYVGALFDKYQVMASVAVPSIIVAWGLVLLDRLKRISGSRAESIIGLGRAIVAVIAVFVIGFLAWRDEHAARTEAENNYNSLLSKSSRSLLGISRLDVSINERDEKDGQFKVRFFNNGQIPAQLYNGLSQITFSEKLEIFSGAKSKMAILEDKLRNLPVSPGGEIEILPNYWWQYPATSENADGKSMTNEGFENFRNGAMYIMLHVVAIYKDDALLSDNTYRLVRFCTAYRYNFNETHACPGENKTIIFNR